MSDLKRAALWYAGHGWPVVPLHFMKDGRCSCGRVRCDSPGKHPTTKHGPKDASRDEIQLDHWWNRRPEANIGIRTGGDTDIVVIDVDPRHGGDESLAELAREHGELPATVEALTGGGGRHLVFKHPGGTVPNRSNMRPGIDVRGDGGYIVAPPSNHASGGQYRWREGHGPHETTPAEMPAWLLALVARGNLEDANADVAPVAEQTPTAPVVLMNERAMRALAAMRGLRADDKKDGSRRLFAAASIAVRFDLDSNAALATIREYLNGAPTPREYGDSDILKRLRDAERTCTRGEALNNGQARRAAAPSTATPNTPPPEPFQAFPVDALPDPLGSFVTEFAAATGNDPACAALAVLVVLAGAIGNRVAAQVKRGWIEAAILWGAIVARSGTTKSAVLKLVTRPLIELYMEARQRYAEALADYQAERQRYEAERDRWKAAQRKGTAISDPPAEPDAPTERRLLVSDVTCEKLGVLLQDNPLGLLLVRDELAAWVGAFDRYASGKGSDAPAWLSFFDAAPVVIDRKSAAGTIFVERASVSVLGTIQPGTLRRVFGAAERESGLLARLLLVRPPTQPMVWTDEELSEATAAEWADLLRALTDIQPGTDDQGKPRPRLIPLAADAKPVYVAWHDAHGRDVADIPADDLAAHFAKLKGICIRLALLFACVDAVTKGKAVAAIGREYIERAIAIVNWLKHEARRVYAILCENEKDRARRQLIEWIERRGGAVTVRELTHGLPQYRGRTDAAKAALDALAETGCGAWEHPAPGPKGGRPSPRFVLATDDAKTKTPAGVGVKDGIGSGDAPSGSARAEGADSNGHAGDGVGWAKYERSSPRQRGGPVAEHLAEFVPYQTADGRQGWVHPRYRAELERLGLL